MTPRVAILADKENFALTELVKGFWRLGAETVVLPASRLSAGVASDGGPVVAAAGVDLTTFDLVMVRQVPAGSLEQVIFRMDALHRLHRAGVPVINAPAAIERMVDKYVTSTLLAEASIPTPATRVCQSFDEAMAAFTQMGVAVAKPIFGSEGHGIVRLTDPDTAYRVFRAWEQIGAVYYLQRFIDHGARDLRAFVVGDRVVAAMEREGAGWKTNVACGAVPKACALSDELSALAVRAARAVGADYAGVDLLPGADGTVYVHEVNSMPGWTGLQQTTDLRIGQVVAEFALRQAGVRAGVS